MSKDPYIIKEAYIFCVHCMIFIAQVHLVEPSLDLKHPDKSKDKDVTLNKNNNLEWNLEINKQETKEVTLKYIVDHPANFTIYTNERLENIA